MQVLEGARLLVNEIKAKEGFNSIPVGGATLTYDSDRPLNNLDLVHKQWVEDNFSSGGGFPDFLEEDTYIGNPDNYSFQLGNEGDAINLNVEVPLEFQGIVDTFSGFDYIGATHKSLIGVLKGVNYPQIGFDDTDVVGTFMIEGDPFNPATGSEGSVFVDGVWYDEEDDAVAANRSVFTLKEGNVDGFNTFHQYRREQAFGMQGDNSEQTLFVLGDDSEQVLSYLGDNGLQQTVYIGNFGSQEFRMQGDSNTHETSMIGASNTIRRENIDVGNNSWVTEEITAYSYNTELSGYSVMKYDDLQGDNAFAGGNIGGDFGSLSYSIEGDFGSLSYSIEGDDGSIYDIITGERGSLNRINDDPISGDSFYEEIKSNSHVTTLDGDYLYEAEAYNVKTSVSITHSAGNYHVVHSPAAFILISGTTHRHQLAGTGNFYLGRNGNYYGMRFNMANNSLGFLGADPIPQQLLPLGSDVDDVITVLHNLGLAKPV